MSFDYARWDGVGEETKDDRGRTVRARPEPERDAKEPRRDAVGRPPRPQPFVNHGLRRWEEGRAKWLRASPGPRPPRRPPVDDEEILDTIFAKPMGWALPRPVPLAHMVELLEDEWSD
mmetsp:Transcript_3678/g.11417  ORF Transcript_3678/g.11417 Transcript_3678/m.11417 type:complete len:118 (-) Transcript_3678:65-418(-)